MRQKPNYTDCDELLVAGGFSKEAVRSAVAYKPKPEDIMIVTFPKSGTTWMQYIVTSILRKGEPFKDAWDFFINSPFLELTGADVVHSMRRPGVLKTHLPIHLAPFSPETKYIYVARNPKDCCVSFYHHTKLIPFYGYENGTFDDYFELFIKGEVDWGDNFDHLLGWYSHRNDPNVYFTTYENMKKDIRGEILKIASFLGEEYLNTLQKDNAFLDNIIRYCSFEYMKIHTNNIHKEFFLNLFGGYFDDNLLPSGLREISIFLRETKDCKIRLENFKDREINFIRKGEIGDWKNYFSSEQNRRMDIKIKEKTKGSDVMNLWEGI